MTSERDVLSRRRAIGLLGIGGVGALAGCRAEPSASRLAASTEHASAMESPAPADRTGADAVRRLTPLTTPWQTSDPFLFCAHHDDRYPAGNASFGPDAPLRGHRIGRDFAGADGWRMYHGAEVPGFPRHPHRGFETITVVRRGLLDHADSLGAAARYGEGDVQWLTAGRGIQHAEMFPLLRRDGDNPLELFQIWLNLPAARKMTDPHFAMLWRPSLPSLEHRDGAGRATRVDVVAGLVAPGAHPAPPSPPPGSYASESDSEVGVWTVRMDPRARYVLPAAPSGVERSLYFFAGAGLSIGGRAIPPRHRVEVEGGSDLALEATAGELELLVLQGRPLGQPVARRGPFVMNTEGELRQAYADYQRTRFGGWPWPSPEPVHGANGERFARRPGGEIERPG